MSQSTTVRLAFANSELSCNLRNGADVTQLILGGNRLIEPRDLDEAENPWLFPFPNRLKNGTYQFDGKTYHFPQNDHGRPNALHGFIRNCQFEVESQGEDTQSAWMKVTYNDAGELAAYPFPFKLSITYKLSASGLVIDVTVQNTGNTSMPAGLGWHPYFALPKGLEGASLKLPPCQEIEVDANMIPTGKKSPSTCFDSYRNLKGVTLDTCFETNVKTDRISTGLRIDSGYEISVWQDAAHGFVQAYTPDDGKSIAIEPMTCGIDAFNTGEGLKVLKPGEIWTVSCGVELI